jgi:hypothetical protein
MERVFLLNKPDHENIQHADYYVPEYFTRARLLETYFTALPDAVVNDALTPSQSPMALVVVSGDVVPANIIAKQVARCCSDRPGWKWEAIPSDELKFLISVPSFEDLDRVDGIQVAVPGFSAPPCLSRHGSLRRYRISLSYTRDGCMLTVFLMH